MTSRVRGTSVALVQSALGDYRAGFLNDLHARLGSRLTIAAGDSHFDESVTLLTSAQAGIHPLKNVYILGRRALWQRRAVSVGVAADVAIVEFNPRIVSAWVTLLIRYALRRRSLLWGHAFPRHGPRGLGMHLRRLMLALAGTLVVYTEAEVAALGARGWRARVIAAPNAVFPIAAMEPATSVPEGFIYVGRLAPEKKPQLMIEAFSAAAPRLGRDRLLTIVGDGPMREELAALARDLGVSEAVIFRGHVSDARELRALYGRALASLSPGYVGLALTQSLGFGVPMIVARDEPHAPEIEAARDGWNVVFADSDSVGSLSLALIEFSTDRDRWLAMRTSIARDARRYSTEAMAAAFMTAIDGVTP